MISFIQRYTIIIKGAGKVPSTAFCLLLRLFTLRCTEKQMTLMLDHVDSPYIRCIGFLYLRYAADPSTLWTWFEPYLYDEEPVQVQQGKSDTTIGDYVRFLLGDLEYYGTRLPRLPLALERQFKVKLLQAELVEERAKHNSKDAVKMEQFQKVGNRIRALYGDEENPVTWYDAVVDRVVLRNDESGELLARPKFWLTFPQYGNTELVTLGEVDVMNGGGGGGVGGGREVPHGAAARGGYSESGAHGRDHDRREEYPRDGRDRGRGGYDRSYQGRRDDYNDPRDRGDARSGRGYKDRGYNNRRHGRRDDNDFSLDMSKVGGRKKSSKTKIIMLAHIARLFFALVSSTDLQDLDTQRVSNNSLLHNC